MKLYPINHDNGRNRYCGPAVISFATGISTADAAKLIRDWSKRRSITGTSTQEVRYVLYKCGFLMEEQWVSGKPTLAAWLRGSQEYRTPGRVFLVVAGHHWQLITGRRYACGRIGELVSIKDDRIKRRARVTEVYELTEMPNQKARLKDTKARLGSRREHEDYMKNLEAKKRRTAHAAAKTHGFTLEKELSMIYCDPPEWVEDLINNGELEIESRIAYDWDEVPDVINGIMELAQEVRTAA